LGKFNFKQRIEQYYIKHFVINLPLFKGGYIKKNPKKSIGKGQVENEKEKLS